LGRGAGLWAEAQSAAHHAFRYFGQVVGLPDLSDVSGDALQVGFGDAEFIGPRR